jgi:tetratricopeptide (TPR) repeat protein
MRPSANHSVACDATAMSLLNTGMSLFYQGELEEAKQYLEKAFNQLGRGYPHPGVVAILNNLGVLLHAQGELEASQNYYEQSLVMLEQLYDSEPNFETLNVLHNLRMVLYAQGKFQKVQRNYDKAIEAFNHLHNKALVLSGFGMEQHLQRNVRDAEDYYKRALDMFWQLYGKSPNFEMFSLLQNLGKLSYAKGELDVARGYYRQALAMGRQLYHREQTPEMLRVLTNLSTILLYIKNKFLGAKLYCQSDQIEDIDNKFSNPKEQEIAENVFLLPTSPEKEGRSICRHGIFNITNNRYDAKQKTNTDVPDAKTGPSP